MEITGDGVGIMVIVLGGLCVVAGIALLLVLLKEEAWWERLLMGMLSMELTGLVPGSMGGMVPLIQQMIQQLLKKILSYVKVGALISGAGVSTLGAVLVVVGIYIVSR